MTRRQIRLRNWVPEKTDRICNEFYKTSYGEKCVLVNPINNRCGNTIEVFNSKHGNHYVDGEIRTNKKGIKSLGDPGIGLYKRYHGFIDNLKIKSEFRDIEFHQHEDEEKGCNYHIHFLAKTNKISDVEKTLKNLIYIFNHVKRNE